MGLILLRTDAVSLAIPTKAILSILAEVLEISALAVGVVGSAPTKKTRRPTVRGYQCTGWLHHYDADRKQHYHRQRSGNQSL